MKDLNLPVYASLAFFILLATFFILTKQTSKFYSMYTQQTTYQNNNDSQTSTPIKNCFVSGCSREVCSDTKAMTICMFKEEYACYKQATCELQSDGNCGWTIDASLQQCISEKTSVQGAQTKK